MRYIGINIWKRHNGIKTGSTGTLDRLIASIPKKLIQVTLQRKYYLLRAARWHQGTRACPTAKERGRTIKAPYLGPLEGQERAGARNDRGELFWNVTVRAPGGCSHILGVLLWNLSHSTLRATTSIYQILSLIWSNCSPPLITFVSLMIATYPDFPWDQGFWSKRSEYCDM